MQQRGFLQPCAQAAEPGMEFVRCPLVTEDGPNVLMFSGGLQKVQLSAG